MKRAKIAPNQPTFTAGDLTLREMFAGERHWFDSALEEGHYMGATQSAGDTMRLVVERRGEPLALFVWGAACYRIADRDAWIGWTATQRAERQKLVVQNRRYALLTAKGAEPNLASRALALCTRSLPAMWFARFGYAPLVAESFTEIDSQAGTCYKASNWEPVGRSSGHSRHRADFYAKGSSIKRLWCKELAPGARAKLCEPLVAKAQAKGASSSAQGVMPFDEAGLDSLLMALNAVIDPRPGKNRRFPCGSILAITALAMLGGHRDMTRIAAFATRLTQRQRGILELPFVKRKGADGKPAPGVVRAVPGYGAIRTCSRRSTPARSRRPSLASSRNAPARSRARSRSTARWCATSSARSRSPTTGRARRTPSRPCR